MLGWFVFASACWLVLLVMAQIAMALDGRMQVLTAFPVDALALDGLMTGRPPSWNERVAGATRGQLGENTNG